MAEVENIFKNEPTYTIAAVCVRCWHRWLGSVMARTSLFGLECPECRQQESFATFLPDEYMQEFR